MIIKFVILIENSCKIKCYRIEVNKKLIFIKKKEKNFNTNRSNVTRNRRTRQKIHL